MTIGGGPAGLYFALLLKKARPEYQITVLERNRAGDTFGWGVVFSDQTLSNFQTADEPTYKAILDHFAHWDDIDVQIKGETITSTGHGFCGIARKTLLQILHDRASDLGVNIRYECDVASLDDLARFGYADADLIVAADGVNSRIRKELETNFVPNLDVRPAKFVWFGTTRQFEAFTFAILQNELGTFQAHCYRFEPNLSTFIVECDAESWKRAGFDTMDTDQSIERCQEMFAEWLQGHPLMSNATHRTSSPWTSFTRVTNQHWFSGNVVLMGDAAHTAHFSIGSGTKLAMEDAISLARAVAAPSNSLHDALQSYQDERSVEALRLQNAARNSMEWFEHVKRYTRFDPQQFAYSLLTRSQRVSHENLRLRDAKYLTNVERWVASQADTEVALAPNENASVTIGAKTDVNTNINADTNISVIVDVDTPRKTRTSSDFPPPPLFTPYRIRGMYLNNRVLVAPMDMYRAVDGSPTDFHLVHIGSRAVGGAALIFTEMTCVAPEGRITPGCTGMYADLHRDAWGRIVDFVHSESEAKICLQIGHAGRKGSTKVPWEGNNVPLDSGNWEVIGPSPIAYGPGLPVPRPMTRDDMDVVREQFMNSTRYAIDANFDMIELHCAHGYLLSSFITPLSNQRTDEYGGSLENRLRYPLEIFGVMRSIWPQDRPMSVRISATDWAEGGITGDEAVAIAKAFIAAGADIIHVSTGQTSSDEQPVYGRMFQTPYSDLIRNEAGVRTIAVGNILDPDQINSIIASGRADLVALGRPHLSDPYWTLHAAADLGYRDLTWPSSYFQGRRQLEREKAKQQAVQQKT